MSIRIAKVGFILLVFVMLLNLGCFLFLRSQPTNEYLQIPIEERSLFCFAPGVGGPAFSLRPNFSQRFRFPEFDTVIRTNATGQREDLPYSGKPLDVGVVGDSFVFGFGVNATERVSDLLRKRHPTMEISSFGFTAGGYPIDYYLFYKTNPQYLGKLNFLFTYLGNDYGSDVEERTYRFNEEGIITDAPFTQKSVRADGSIAYIETSSTVGSVLKYLDQFSVGKVLLMAYGSIRSNIFQPKVPPQQKPKEWNDLDSGNFSKSAIQSLTYLKLLNEWIRKEGKGLIVVQIPETFRVRKHGSCPYEETKCTDLLKNRRAQTHLTRWFQENGIESLDLTPLLQDAERSGTKAYFDEDAHWTVLGHQVAADAVEHYLKK